MSGEVTEAHILGGTMLNPDRLVAEHNEQARIIREQAAEVAGSLATEQKLDGPEMDPRRFVSPEEVTEVRSFIVDL